MFKVWFQEWNSIQADLDIKTTAGTILNRES